MATSRNYSWKVLAIGRGPETAAKAEEHLHALGYKNSKVIGVDNDKASDDQLSKLIQENDWDAISIGESALFY
jgi:predicted RNA methylase